MAAATMYVTVAGAGTKAGNTWANAMDLAAWKTDVEGSAEAGDIYYVYSGTYTLPGAWDTALAGTTLALISVIGCSDQGTPPTEATGADRPAIAAGANSFIFEDYYWLRNLIVTTTHADGFKTDQHCHISNCKVTNSNAAANKKAGYFYNENRVWNSEFISTNGVALAFYSSAPYVCALGNYCHDSKTGIYCGYKGGKFLFNIIDTCSAYGLQLNAGRDAIVNNTIYNCTTAGIYGGASAEDNFIFNNQIISNGIGASFANDEKSNRFDYNNWYGNTSDVSNATKGDNATANDPGFADAGGGNFSGVDSADAFKILLGVG